MQRRMEKKKTGRTTQYFLNIKSKFVDPFTRRHLLLEYSEKSKRFIYVSNMQVATDVGESEPVAA